MREEIAVDEAEVQHLFTQARDAARQIEEARQQMACAADRRRDAIAALRQRGLSYGDIAATLGCSRSAIQSILRTDSR
jgi:DNA-directed RNA polymerase specialized sigma24 family protein